LPVWELIEQEDLSLSGLVYFTDLDCDTYHTGTDQKFPVLWCVFNTKWADYYGGFDKAKDYLPKFGQIVVMEET
jgi:hypothetical protein